MRPVSESTSLNGIRSESRRAAGGGWKEFVTWQPAGLPAYYRSQYACFYGVFGLIYVFMKFMLIGMWFGHAFMSCMKFCKDASVLQKPGRWGFC